MITSAKQRALIHERATEMNEKAGLQKRGFTAQETRDFDDLMLDIKEWDERQTFTPTSGSSFGSTGSGKQEARFYTSDSDVYNDPYEVGTDAPSFFKDIRSSRMGDYQAMERLSRNAAARGQETRAGDMTTVAGAGGTFAPPAWLVGQFIAPCLARAGA